jgi:erythromycin esterase-like protein
MRYGSANDERVCPMGSFERDETSTWKIALGVTLGTLAAGAITFFVRAWIAQAAIEQISKQAEKMVMQQQRAAQAAHERAVAEKAEQDRAAAYAAATDAAMRRERAWAKYYKRPAMCDDQPSNETMMKCANEHIRAKRQFDLEYDTGKL